MGGTASAKPKKSGAEVPRSTSRDDTPFVEAAWLYYHDGLNQNAIKSSLEQSYYINWYRACILVPKLSSGMAISELKEIL